MGDTEDTGSLFNNIVGDMKTMGPLWEDLLVKASKFYVAVKQSAVTADAFLDAFQKIADATTNSKGATRDIGVSFTKIVMRHKAIEMKLKTYVGILADSFVTPLQVIIDEWKKNGNQLEKDHTKDYKRFKGELKKANTEAQKLKKKASKKIGKQEYTDQFRESMKIANQLCKTLEEQEKLYLRKLMVEERSRAAQFFRCYKPCVEQELTLISEIEQLQSIIEETTGQCAQPSKLPELSEDAINNFKVPDSLQPGSRNSSTTSSPPSSPIIVQDRKLSLTSSKNTLTRNTSNPYTNGLDPIPVSVPTAPNLAKSPSVSSRSSYSSSSSIDQQHPVYDPVTLNEIEHQNYSPAHHQSNTSGEMVNIHKTLKTRSSWSSIETSDSSSGIGSHNSLTNKQYSSNPSMPYNQQHNGSDSDPIDHDIYTEPHYPQYIPHQNQSQQYGQFDRGFHQAPGYTNDQMKYATIDRSHFRKNQYQTSSLRETNGVKPRSNSLDEGADDFPSFPDYKMNLPKTKTHTIAGRPGQINQNSRPTVFQVFDGHDPSELLKRLSPTSTPFKKAPPPAPQRRNSSPAHHAPRTAPKPSKGLQRSRTMHSSEPKPYTIDNDPDEVTPGSFQDALLQRRKTMRSLSVDQSVILEKYRY